MFNIPKEFQQKIIGAHGDKGQQWLSTLPQLIARYEDYWELTSPKPVAHLSYNYVMTAFRNNQPVVLKLGVPQSEFSREIGCLAHYEGDGAPKLLASDIKQGAMLMEQIIPGTTLKSYFPHDEEASLAITAKVIQQLHSAKVLQDPEFPDIERWHASLNNTSFSSIIPEDLLTTAKQLSQHLIATQAEPVLLHADLHHDNILLDENDRWLAIDPKGIIGEPAYDLGAFIRNPFMELRQQTNKQAILKRRVEAFAEYLDLDRDRIVQWSFVQAVLSACWSMEEKNAQEAECAINIAKLLSRL
jgi:streptomycin 6-kinase